MREETVFEQLERLEKLGFIKRKRYDLLGPFQRPPAYVCPWCGCDKRTYGHIPACSKKGGAK